MSKKNLRMLTVQEFRSLFGEESGCGEQLNRQRWPDGFRCPRCDGPSRGYMSDRQVHECARCAYQCSVTAGTIFHKTRTPLTSWFWAIYRMSHDKKGISALQLSKEIGVGYRTAWLMQHKIRKAMDDRDQSYKLSGLIEVDEGYVGGEEHGEAPPRGAAPRASPSWPWRSNIAPQASRAGPRSPASQRCRYSRTPVPKVWTASSRTRSSPAAMSSPTAGTDTGMWSRTASPTPPSSCPNRTSQLTSSSHGSISRCPT